MRVIFAGTPEFAVPALAAVTASGAEVVSVLTQPDRPSGRGMRLTHSPVKTAALAAGCEVLQPDSLKPAEVQQALRDRRADLMVVAAYGLILPAVVLAIPRLGCINVHASLLPRWRGAAPIQRAILAGDRRTGISIMQMDVGLDTGAVLLEKPLDILPDDTAATLHDRLAALGGVALAEALPGVAAGTLLPVPQPEAGVTYAAKLTKEEALLDWARPADVLERAVRAYDPFPVAHTRLRGEVLRIWRADMAAGAGGPPGVVLRADADGVVVACATGALRITELQRPGGPRRAAGPFLQGCPIAAGELLGA